MSKKILFTGGGGAGNEAIWSLLNHKYDLYFADCDIDNIDSVIPVSQRIEIPSANSIDFVSSISIVCKEKGINFLVPTVDEELVKLSKTKNQLSCELILPHSEFVETMLDKYAFSKVLEKISLSRPETYYADQWKKLKFPMIIKPRSGRGSRGVMVINNEKELEAYRVLNPLANNELIVQELGIGEEYTVFVSSNKNGELNCIIPVRVEQKRGVTISAITHKEDTIIEYVKSFHDSFIAPGIYNLQCIISKEGKVLPFEVNPRVSTTFCMALAAGFDPFELYQEESKELFFPEKPIRLKRNWKNTFASENLV